MSTPFTTAAVLEQIRSLQGRKVTLAKIVLATPSALTLRWATTEVITPDGKLWQAGLAAEPTRDAVDLLGTGLAPTTATIRLPRRADASQSSGVVANLLSSYLWQNAVVTLYIWDQGPFSAPSSESPQQVFSGRVSRPDVDAEGVTLYLLQDESWNRVIPTTVIDDISYPNAPDGQQGQPIPIVYGDHIAPPMASLWPSTYGNKDDQEDVGAGLGVVPMFLVDPGIGSAKAKIVAAAHLCVDILNRADGHTQFIDAGGVMAPLDTAGITETLGASESFIEIADEGQVAYFGVLPMDVRTTGAANTATNPRRAMDVFDETNYASMNQATPAGILQLVLPNMPPRGRIDSVELVVAFIGDAGNGNNLRAGPYQPGVGYLSSVNTASTGTTPAVWRTTWPTGAYSQAWDFGGSATAYDLRIDFTGGATNKASIIWAALVVKYRPQQSLVTPGYIGFTIPIFPTPTGPLYEPFTTQSAFIEQLQKHGYFQVAQPQFSLVGRFYGNIKGYADTAGGAFTGTASALIQRPPDIVNHILQTYAGVSASDVETAVGGFGSFVDARDTLRNGQPTDLKLAAHVGELSSVKRVLQHVCEQSGLCVVRDRFTDKWRCHAWKPGALTDYDLKLRWEDVSDLSIEETSIVDSATDVRIRFGYDHPRGRTLYEAFVSPTGSSQGVTQRTVRDQILTITLNVNDDLDFKVGATTYACVLAAGTYTRGIDLAEEIQTKMKAASAGIAEVRVSYGFHVKTGHNHLLDFKRAAAVYQATIPDGDYSADALALAAQIAMNAVPGHGLTFAVTYTHSTNKFSFAWTGAGGDAITLDPGGAAGDDSVLQTMGFKFTTASAVSPIPSGSVCYTDRFAFTAQETRANFGLLFSTGASAATDCADAIGYTATDLLTINRAMADYSRGARESLASDNLTRYGPRPARSIQAEWIRDETTAVELRNRIFDLTARPRAVVRFRTFRCPDLRLMQTIEFSSDIDAYIPFISYGSNGSWAGKVFRVIEVMQYLGPQYHQEVVAVAV